MKWEFLDRELCILTPKFLPNLPRKSSKTERHGVRKEEDESLPLFSFTLRRGRSVGGGVAELSLVGDYCYRNLLSLTDDCL